MKCSPTTTLYVEPIFQKVVLLGGGFKHVFFHPDPWGKWIQFDARIFFRVGKNHQLVKVLKCHSPSDFCSPTNPSTSWEWYWNPLSLYIYYISCWVLPSIFVSGLSARAFISVLVPKKLDQLLPVGHQKKIRCKGSGPQNPWKKSGGIILVCPEKMWLFFRKHRHLHLWRLTWNVMMEVWFRSFSFLDGWFVGCMLIFQGVYQPEITLKQNRAMQDQRLYQAIGSSVFWWYDFPNRIHVWYIMVYIYIYILYLYTYILYIPIFFQHTY